MGARRLAPGSPRLGASHASGAAGVEPVRPGLPARPRALATAAHDGVGPAPQPEAGDRVATASAGTVPTDRRRRTEIAGSRRRRSAAMLTPTDLSVVDLRRRERLAGAARARLVAGDGPARPSRPAPRPPGLVRASVRDALAALASVLARSRAASPGGDPGAA
jgi:hypothetical protein